MPITSINLSTINLSTINLSTKEYTIPRFQKQKEEFFGVSLAKKTNRFLSRPLDCKRIRTQQEKKTEKVQESVTIGTDFSLVSFNFAKRKKIRFEKFFESLKDKWGMGRSFFGDSILVSKSVLWEEFICFSFLFGKTLKGLGVTAFVHGKVRVFVIWILCATTPRPFVSWVEYFPGIASPFPLLPPTPLCAPKPCHLL